MPKYFMDGTKYAPFERMMMEPPKTQRSYPPREKKKNPAHKGHREHANRKQKNS